MSPLVNGDNATANETTPLLPSHTEEHGNQVKVSESQHNHRSLYWGYVVGICIALAVTVDIGEYLFLAPKVRLFESIVCTDYYLRENPSLVDRDGSVQERFCKVDPVQDTVTMILGWQLFFDSIPAILLPIPYGYLADTYGRKWIAVLSMIGYTLSLASTLFVVGVLHLPLQYVWLSSLFFLIGGGPTTGTTLITTMVADVAPPDRRSSVFFYRFASDLIAECFVPPVTSRLMSETPWIPLLTALVFQVLGVIMTFILPETLSVTVHERDHSVSNNPPAARSSGTDEDPILGDELENHSQCKLRIRRIKVWFDFVIRDATVTALLFTFLVSKVGRQSMNILLQYVSIRYGWVLSKATLLLSLRAGMNIILYIVVLPFVAASLLPETSSAFKDLWVARVSIILMIVGTAILSTSTIPALMIIGLIVYTFGTGFAPVIRSLITFQVESHHANNTSDIGRLYALISVLEGLGSLVAGPSMAWAFRFGMSLGQGWLGLPFALAAVLFALVSVLVFSIRI